MRHYPVTGRFGPAFACAAFTTCALLFQLQPTAAQDTPPDPGRAVAAAVQSFYDQTTDVSASFHQTYVNRLYKRTDRSKGKVVFKKPGKMRWDYAKPNGKVIVAGSGTRIMPTD